MRLAPVALFALHDAERADRLARDQSRTTHGAPEAIEACAFFVQLLRAAILGEKNVLRCREWAGSPTVRAIAAGGWRGKTREQIRSTGYIIDTLEAALWAVGTTTDFESALILAVNLGGDADTVGALTGQLAGGLYGACAIPRRWLQPLACQKQLIGSADDCLKHSGFKSRSGS